MPPLSCLFIRTPHPARLTKQPGVSTLSPVSRATILYDSGCGFCRWAIDKILAWDRRNRLRLVPLQDPESDRLLPRMDQATKMSSWHLVMDDGQLRSAGAAVAPLLALLPGGRPLAAIAGTLPRMTDRGYRLVARNRDRLGRWLGAEACAVDPGHRRTRA